MEHPSMTTPEIVPLSERIAIEVQSDGAVWLRIARGSRGPFLAHWCAPMPQWGSADARCVISGPMAECDGAHDAVSRDMEWCDIIHTLNMAMMRAAAPLSARPAPAEGAECDGAHDAVSRDMEWCDIIHTLNMAMMRAAARQAPARGARDTLGTLREAIEEYAAACVDVALAPDKYGGDPFALLSERSYRDETHRIVEDCIAALTPPPSLAPEATR